MVLPLLSALPLALALDRPNILFLQCDEMDGRILDPRHPLSQVTALPHLRGLAKAGVNFVNAYSENPLCAPSRASTFTGRRTSSIRTWNNVKALTTLIGEPSVADPTCAKVVGYGEEWCVAEGQKQNVTTSIRHALTDLNYDVQIYGKVDTGGGVCRPGIDVCSGTGYHDDGNWSTTKEVRTYWPGDLLHSWAGSAGIAKPVFQPLDARNGWIDEAHPGGGPFARDWETVEKCVSYLRTLPAVKPSSGHRPFALYCSVVDPHPPYFTNATWLAQVDDGALDATVNATRWMPLEFVHPADRFQATAEGVPARFNVSLSRRLARAWHGQTAETDAMVGAVLAALERDAPARVAANTLVLFTSDHGEMHLEHRHVEKMTHYEGSARVPLIVVAPPRLRHLGPAPSPMRGRMGRTETTLVSLLDILPTFLDAAGSPAAVAGPGRGGHRDPAIAGGADLRLDGYSLLPLLLAGGTPGSASASAGASAGASAAEASAASLALSREQRGGARSTRPPRTGTRRPPTRPPYVAAMAACDSLNAGQFMLRQGKWKLVVYATAANASVFPPQLFDVNADMGETRNVAEQNGPVVRAMDATLRGEIDYPQVMRDYEAQGREWAGRWTAAFVDEGRERGGDHDDGEGDNGGGGWKPLLRAAYRNFTDVDERKFVDWLNSPSPPPSPSPTPTPPPPPPRQLKHPGVFISAPQLAYIRRQVATAEGPVYAAYVRALNSTYARGPNTSGPTPGPPANGVVECGSYDRPDRGCSAEHRDSVTAYLHSLLWAINGRRAHAGAAMRILNAYARGLREYNNSNAPLEAAWSAEMYTKAAELLAHAHAQGSSSPWPEADRKAMARMLTTVVLPLIEDGSGANGNWELSMIDALAGIAVFTDDAALLDRAARFWRERVPAYFYYHTDGRYPVPVPRGRQAWNSTERGSGSWYGQTFVNESVDGLCQETCRDLGHTQMGLAAALNAAETARIQGVDLYGQEEERLVAAMEFHSQILLEGGAPPALEGLLCGGAAVQGASRSSPTFVVGLNEYARRRGLGGRLPYTTLHVASQVLPITDPAAGLVMAYETLSHGGSPSVGP